MESSRPAGPVSRRHNGVLVLMAVALFAAGAAVGIGLRPSGGKELRDQRASALENGSVPPDQSVRRETASTGRAAILDAIARAPVKGPEDVDRYLDTLFEQARRRGRVTALDIEPGIAVALNHSSDSNKVEAFTSRMLDLQRQLAGKPIEEPTPADSRERSVMPPSSENRRVGSTPSR
jgi:hypothetical protein